MKKKGIPFGCLWAILILMAYLYAFVGIGVYLIWKGGWPDSILVFFKTMGLSFGYVALGILGAIPVLIIAVYFSVRDRNIRKTFEIWWPLILACIYPFFPNFPGPVDELVVGLICAGLQIITLTKQHALQRESEEEDEDDDRPRKKRKQLKG